MECSYGYEDNDPASLTTSLVMRMPGIESKAAVYLRDASVQFFQDSMVWRDQRKMLPINADQTRYVIPDYAMGEPCKVIAVWALPSPGYPREWKIPEQREIQVDDSQNWHSPTSNQITFHLPFGLQTSVRLHVALRPVTRNKAKALADPNLLTTYREGIMSYALRLATLAQGQNTEDMTTADFYMREYQRHVELAKLQYKRVLSGERRSLTSRQRDTARSRTPRRV